MGVFLQLEHRLSLTDMSKVMMMSAEAVEVLIHLAICGENVKGE